MLAWADRYFGMQGLLIDVAKLADEKDPMKQAAAAPNIAKAAREKVELFFDFCGTNIDREQILADADMDEFNAAVRQVMETMVPLVTRSLLS